MQICGSLLLEQIYDGFCKESYIYGLDDGKLLD